jgi:hypothetical protein
MMWMCAYAQAGQVINNNLITRPFRHHVWQEILTFYVNSKAEVDFAKVRAHPKRLNDYLEQLAACSPENDPDAFPRATDRTAYWINAHNALAMRIILDHYPIVTTAQIPNMETNIRYQLGGNTYSLKKIRLKLGLYAKQDPPLLFTLTDYTVSAPRIQREAFAGDSLKRLKTQATVESVSNPAIIQTQNGSACTGLKLSAFFKGYEGALLSRTPASVDDAVNVHEADFVPVSLSRERWTDQLRTRITSTVYTRPKKDCEPSVAFMPQDKTLRQLRF